MPEKARSRWLGTPDASTLEAAEGADTVAIAKRAELEGRLPGKVLRGGLRGHTARGTMINAAFQVSLAALNLLRRVVVAAFLTTSEYGLWGAMLASLFLVVFLKDAGFTDKFIQQSDDDQEAAFQKLFTLELMFSGAVIAVAAGAIPLFAAAYGRPDIIVPGLVLSLAVLGSSLQAPNVIYYRNMDFFRQRVLQAVDPVVAFAVTIGLAVAGAGVWSLVVGAVVGSFAGAAVALAMCPYRLGLRFKRETLSEYFNFSWPLVLARGEVLVVGQASLLIATRTSGVAAAGAIGLATAITQFAHGVDNIVTRTAYPAICAVRHRSALLFEVFVKSNRLALIWGLPFGFGVALFAPDLVHFAIGDKWEPAIIVIQALGVAAGADQLGFNWSAFLRALGFTRPLATLAIFDFVAFLAATTPLLIAFGLPGFAVGVLVAEVVRLGGRAFFLKQLFPQFDILRHMIRAAVPVLPAVGVILAARAIESGDRSPELAAVELAAFLILVTGTTIVTERKLFRELREYLRSGSRQRQPVG